MPVDGGQSTVALSLSSGKEVVVYGDLDAMKGLMRRTSPQVFETQFGRIAIRTDAIIAIEQNEPKVGATTVSVPRGRIRGSRTQR